MKVGYFCGYLPPELIRSAGGEPVLLEPEGKRVKLGEKYFPTPFCPFSKVFLDNLLSGSWEKVGTLLFTRSCDASRRLYETVSSLPGGESSFLLDLPHEVGPLAWNYFAHQLKKLAHFLLDRTGKSEKAMLSDLEQEVKSSLIIRRKLTEEYQAGRLPGAVFLGKEGGSPPDFPRVVRGGLPLFLIASHLWVRDLIGLLEKKSILVFEDTPLGSRRWLLRENTTFLLPPEEDPFLSLSRLYLEWKAPCPRGPWRERLAFIQEMTRKLGVRGVVYFYPKFCDFSLYELKIVRDELSLPVLSLEYDTLPNLAQWETRLEAFLEVLTP
ncbi:MAG: hypothetical protein PWP04_221 [Candidatus Atribacteria bacterium]|nr:hypothetical protein [Candidatus Atribacteria bacterium]